MSKRILIVGPNYFGYNESVENGFKKLGWETEIISYYEAWPNSMENFLRYRLFPRMGLNHYRKEYRKSLNQSIITTVKERTPELILFIKGTYIEEETLKELKKDSKLILWMMDSLYRFNDVYKNVRYFDYKFMFEESDVKKLEKEEIDSGFLPMAADSDNYFPIESTEKDIDVLFVGKLYPNRLELFDNLISRFPNLNIKIYGNYTSLKRPSSYMKYHFTNMKNYYTNQFVSPKELNVLYSRSKIALNIHHSQSQSGCNPRVFEILAAKAFQLVDEIPFIKKHFHSNNSLSSYTDQEDLFNKIDYYLKNEGERKRIAETGYNHVIQNHTFLKRVETILDAIEKE
jgi:spore maturation protein CgeB